MVLSKALGLNQVVPCPSDIYLSFPLPCPACVLVMVLKGYLTFLHVYPAELGVWLEIRLDGQLPALV